MLQLLSKGYRNKTIGTGQRRQHQRSMGWLLLAAILMFATMLAQQSYASVPEGAVTERVVPENAGSGSFYWRGAGGPDAQGTQAGYRQALHRETEVRMAISGLTASVTVVQTFANNSNSWQEGIYVFPLPENSAVNQMTMTIGERTIQGKIAERAEAKQVYQQAKANGQKAALVEQERPNLFTQSVANIGPGEQITIELRYQQPVRYDAGTFSLRFPMTLTPRYIPGEAVELPLSDAGHGWATPTARVPDAHRITPRYIPPQNDAVANPVSLAVVLDAGYPLQQVLSPTHKLAIDMPGSGVRHIRLADAKATMDRDFELRWRPQSSADTAAAIFHEQRDGDSFVQLMLLPPATQETTESLPRELTLIIDTSGSMAGPSMQQAKQSLLWALDQLQPQDNFNIIAFASDHRRLYQRPAPASSTNIDTARAFVNALEARGGTEMAPALRAALQSPSSENQKQLKQVVFITDGAVGNEAELFQIIDSQLGNARLFTVGIGSAPNSYFMRKAAEFGRGTFTYIADTQTVEARMGELFDKLSHPVMSSIEVHWPRGGHEAFPEVIPDLYLGEPLVINAHFPGGLDSGSEISVFGNRGNSGWRRYISVPQARSNSPIVATQWARAKIEALLDEKVKGADPATVREEVLQVALPFQLMSPYTSFIAVEEQPSRPAYEDIDSSGVLNHLPAGQSAHALMYPQTATSASFHLLSGLMVLLLLWVIRRGLSHA